MTKPAYLPCLVCGKAITESVGMDEGAEGFHHQPYGATTFYTSGHYGSTFFDPMNDSERLVICICDDCLRLHKDRLAYIRVVRWERRIWERYDPNATDE